MSEFRADIRDLKFAVLEQLELDPLLKEGAFSEFSPEDLEMIIDEAHKFAKEVYAPCNEEGDRVGAQFKDGKVTMPDSFKRAFSLYREGSWLGLNCNPDFGGQGAPALLRIAVDELFFGANIGLHLGIMLTPAAAHVIENFGSDEQKKTYVEKLYTGEWLGTMCLTEAHAGSDVGAAKTKATKEGDHYLIEGEKIFITYGEHDMSENIIHTVLARTEGSPNGTKGLSLFIVPKYRLNDDGSPGEFNDVNCTNVEHKMGMHASPTCTLHFGASGKCKGYLLGNEREGMKMMFQMMNEARIHVGLQGSALGSAAYQSALAYAQDRLQGSDLKEFKNPDAPRVPITRHPDVRVMLMQQKAYVEGMRALLLFASYCHDRSHVEKDTKERNKYKALLEIFTPICKAYCSDMGFVVTERAIQTLGGYGYLKDYPCEQYMRDCKIASIYEGTNGIQALDLVGRKLGMNGGANVMALNSLISKFISANKEHSRLGDMLETLEKGRARWGKINALFMKLAAQKKLMTPLLNATSYLGLCGDLLMGYFLAQQAVIADGKLEAICKDKGVDINDGKAVAELGKDNADARFYDNKIKTARYFCNYELPKLHAKADGIESEDMSAYFASW